MSGVTFDAIRRLARDCDRTDDPVVRQELARSYTRFEILKWLGQRARAAAKAGKSNGSEASVMKLAISQRVARDGDLTLSLEGPAGMLHQADAPSAGLWQQMFLNQWSVRIGGGTEQIQKQRARRARARAPRRAPPRQDPPLPRPPPQLTRVVLGTLNRLRRG